MMARLTKDGESIMARLSVLVAVVAVSVCCLSTVSWSKRGYKLEKKAYGYLKQSRWLEAIVFLNKLIAANPKFAYYYSSRCGALFRLHIYCSTDCVEVKLSPHRSPPTAKPPRPFKPGRLPSAGCTTHPRPLRDRRPPGHWCRCRSDIRARRLPPRPACPGPVPSRPLFPRRSVAA